MLSSSGERDVSKSERERSKAYFPFQISDANSSAHAHSFQIKLSVLGTIDRNPTVVPASSSSVVTAPVMTSDATYGACTAARVVEPPRSLAGGGYGYGLLRSSCCAPVTTTHVNPGDLITHSQINGIYKQYHRRDTSFQVMVVLALHDDPDCREIGGGDTPHQQNMHDATDGDVHVREQRMRATPFLLAYRSTDLKLSLCS